MQGIRPFWRYYGGKWRAATRYPKPEYDTIIEPFAGSAGYSLRYPDRKVILVEKYHVIAEIWRYLISVQEGELLRIPPVDNVEDLPPWVPEGGRFLVGFCMNDATVSPCKRLSSGKVFMRTKGLKKSGWTIQRRELVASQLHRIRHWQVIEGGYESAPNMKASWFVDPPYNNKAGSYYKHHLLDYNKLGQWCKMLPGQVIVCENHGADWLPFVEFGDVQASPMSRKTGLSKEVIWTNSAIDSKQLSLC